MRRAVFAIALLAACGDDTPTATQSAQAGAAAAAVKKDDKNKLQPRMHVEDNVVCPAVGKPTGVECKIDAPTCDPGLACLPTAAGYHCEPCPERDSIRHDFKDRDFIADTVRDPFYSYTLIQPGLGSTEPKVEVTKVCQRQDQMIATNYSYQDLKLVGIVAQGTQRKALMMDTGSVGHIIRRGDCVGKEKAVVKDIGTGYITFGVDADPGAKVPRPNEEHSFQLHPNDLAPSIPGPEDMPPPPTAPIVAPPAAPKPPAPAPAPKKP